MIPLDDALTHLAGVDDVEAYAGRRLRGEDTRPVMSPWLEESPCDVLVPLLSPDAPEEVQEAVLRAWKELYPGVLGWLSAPKRTDSEQRVWLSNLCRVAELSADARLSGQVRTLLSGAIAAEIVDPDLVYEVFSALRGIGLSEDDWSLLTRMIEHPETAAAGFQGMLEIDPHDSRVTQSLAGLICSVHKHGWDVDTIFLLTRLEETAGTKGPVVKVINGLSRHHMVVWNWLRPQIEATADEGENRAREWVERAQGQTEGNLQIPRSRNDVMREAASLVESIASGFAHESAEVALDRPSVTRLSMDRISVVHDYQMIQVEHEEFTLSVAPSEHGYDILTRRLRPLPMIRPFLMRGALSSESFYQCGLESDFLRLIQPTALEKAS